MEKVIGISYEVMKMSDKNEHALGGAMAGILGYCVSRYVQGEPIDPNKAIGCGLIGAVAGVAPDLMEPATGPKHRGFVHSGTTVALVTGGIKKVWENPELNSEQKAILTALGMSFLSHHALDADTPAGIPLLNESM